MVKCILYSVCVDSLKMDSKSKKTDYVSTEEEECTSPKVEKRKRKKESKTSTPSPKGLCVSLNHILA